MKKQKISDIEREEELYALAVGRCLDKIDWDISDWLNEEEEKEYWELYEKNNN